MSTDRTEPSEFVVVEDAATRDTKRTPKLMWQVLEVYKCLALTISAIALVGIYLKTPTPFTLENLKSKAVDVRSIPVVRVQGGSMSVDVENTVDVRGSVSIE
jgi:hypothetical protein